MTRSCGLSVPKPRLRWAETTIVQPEGGVEPALRLLARLLVRAATATGGEKAADSQIPLDVAVAPKVGSDRR